MLSQRQLRDVYLPFPALIFQGFYDLQEIIDEISQTKTTVLTVQNPWKLARRYRPHSTFNCSGWTPVLR